MRNPTAELKGLGKRIEVKLGAKGSFVRSVLTLMTGTSIAQAISILVSPLLTRMYDPSDFGILALFGSIVATIGVVATGRYELAILLPKKEDDAANLVALSMSIALVLSGMTGVVILFCDSEIAKLLNNPLIGFWLYWIPVSVFFTGLYQTLSNWVNRKKEYRRLAISRIAQ